MITNSRILAAISAAFVLSVLAPINASAVAIVVNTEIVEMELSGGGSIPLGTAADPAQADDDSGYRFVDTTFTASESATLASSGAVSVSLTGTTIDVSLGFDLFLDFVITDNDGVGVGNDFAADGFGVVPSSLSLTASTPAHAMSITLAASVDLFTVLNSLPADATEEEIYAALIADTQTASPVYTQAVFDLGRDVNANGEGDVLKIGPTNISFDENDLDVDIVGGDLGALADAILSGMVTDPIVINANISLSAFDIDLEGDVLDAISDPHFTLFDTAGSFTGLASTAAAAPEPGSLLLLLAGLGLLAARGSGQRGRSL